MFLKLIFLITTSSHAETTISKEYNLETLYGRSKIYGIWKLKLEANQKVEFKAYTYRKKNSIETDCQEFSVKMYVSFVMEHFIFSLKLVWCKMALHAYLHHTLRTRLKTCINLQLYLF